MPYLIYAIDHPDKHDLREAEREAHRKYLAKAGEKLLASGALLDDNDEKITGGVTLLDVETRQEAQQFVKDDPYSKAGIRKEIQILRWRKRWWEGQFLA